MGRVCQTTDQEGFSEYFYYDEEGRLETRIDRNGNKTTTHYNMDGNLSYQRAEDKKGRNPVASRYRYYPDGKLRQAEGGGITYDYAYTPNGLLKSKSASGKTLLEYAYDRSRNLSCLTDSAGNSLHYTYDAMDRLKQVSEGQGDILTSYSYNPSGGLCRLQYGNGIQTEYGYNDSGTLSSLVTVTKQGQVLLNYNYAYDGNGNCIQKSGAPYQNTYAYDRMNRLLEAVQDGKPEKYTYDLAGNRLRKESRQKTEIYEYNAKNQLTGIQSGEKTIQYRYDPQGNMLEELGRTWKKRYAYDAANRQQEIELTRMSEGRAEYCHQSNRYDGEGLRYETKENGKVIRFLFDRGELAEEIREDAQIRYARGYDPLSLTWNGAEKSYFVPDEMGSTLFLLDKDHEIQKTYRYDAFGDILNESGDTFNRLTYTGQMYDGEMGQYYLRARFYNPSIGRFMQEDIYRGDGLNLYAYCANNPVMYFDPSGYIGLCDPSKANTYSVANPLNNPSLDKIYKNWIADGIDPADALEYLTKFGNRPDIEFLPYIDQYTAQAYQDILSKGDAAFTTRQLEVLEDQPYLRDAFTGSEIDKKFKNLVETSPKIPQGTYYITKVGQDGADLYYMQRYSNWWIDITTKNQAKVHFNTYSGNGYVTPYR